MEEVVMMGSSQQDKPAFLKAKETSYLCKIHPQTKICAPKRAKQNSNLFFLVQAN